MKQHSLEDVEELKPAAKEAQGLLLGTDYDAMLGCFQRIKEALAKFEPKPEKVYVLDENQRQVITEWVRQICYDLSSGKIINHDTAFDELRELTAVDAATAPVQKWRVPTWGDLEKPDDFFRYKFQDNKGYAVFAAIGKESFNAFRAKIMSMNEVR
jgi:hypothetical protein